MKILMLTNTYLPHVGGVARSVEAFSDEYRRRGHQVLVVAPDFANTSADEHDVVRVPAIQRFNGSDFAVRLPVPGFLMSTLNEFQPELVHAHHPFLLGDTALRIAAARDLPLVFTHHTMYERYTHYVPVESKLLQRYVIDLATGYANLCDRVFAPSESVAEVLRARGVQSPIDVVPTGVDVARFAAGDGRRIRRELGIPENAFVVGHLGRLAPEKNLEFLANAVAAFLKESPGAHFLVAGAGPSETMIRETFRKPGLDDRLHMAGTRQGRELVDTYHAMDLFAFASHTETQGMVLTEGMAAGLPAVALDAPGAREVVRDFENGRLLHDERVEAFVGALDWIARQTPTAREALRRAARQTAENYAMPRCAEHALRIYQSLVERNGRRRWVPRNRQELGPWESTLRLIDAQWQLWTARAHAAGVAMQREMPNHPPTPPPGSLVRVWNRLRRLISG